MQCEQKNGIFLGYEVKLYYDERIFIKQVNEAVTTYSISPKWKAPNFLPKAISVAAINELGVGNHSPLVKINQSG